MSVATDTPLLRVRGLSKAFPGLLALDGVDLTVSSGEIVAVVGQNGSGKSTLVKILAGVYQADPGSEVEVYGSDGTRVTGAMAGAELRFIHQDLGLIGTLNTVENLDLGLAYGHRLLAPSRRKAERARARELIARFGASFDVDLPVASLTASERTIVAIARALSDWTGSDHVLVLDEPTAALRGEESGRLFEAVRRVADEGAGILFISHHLEEVLDLADRIVVLRDGQKVADTPADHVDEKQLVELIVGREVDPAVLKHKDRGEAVLEVSGLSGATLREIDLRVNAGEIVGVTGIIGSGRERLTETIFGAARADAGVVRVSGRRLPAGDPRAAVAAGLGFVPADRHRAGAVMTMSARENLTLPRMSPLRRRFGRLDAKAERREAASWAADVELRPPEMDRPLELYSGGNQQKVVIAKWLRNDPRLLLLDEPTQGVDVGAKAKIHELIGEAAAGGAGVLVCSSDTEELTVLCDRVLVLRDGKVAAELRRDALSETALLNASMGLAEIPQPTDYPQKDDHA